MPTTYADLAFPRAVVYFPPATRAILADPGVPLLLTEGEKKAAKADQEGFACIGLVGVYGWVATRPLKPNGKKSGPLALTSDLAAINWAQRRLTIVFDSDLSEKPEVRLAEWRFAEALLAVGADVKVVHLPPGPRGAKVGLDDFLIAKGPVALQRLIDAAVAPGPPNANWSPPTPFGRTTPPPAFPVEVLPTWLRDFVSAISIATQTPPDASSMLALAAVAGGLAGKFRYRIRPGFTKNANLYIVVAMDPGERKSAVFKAVFAPIYEVEKAVAVVTGPRVAQAKAELGILESRLKHLQGRAGKVDDPALSSALKDQIRDLAAEIARFDMPTGPRFVVDDETLENLARTLIEQGGRLLQAAAEGTAFEIAGGRYAESENFDVYLKAHDGDPLRVGRVSRGYSCHDSPCLTCGLAVQPDVLRGLGMSAKAKGRGFLARWLYGVPAPRVGTREIRPTPVSTQVLDGYTTQMQRLWAIDTPDEPKEVLFDPSADDALAEFEGRIEPRLGPDGDLSGLASWGTKLAGEVARIAGAMHIAGCADPTNPGPVTRAAVEAAVRLADEYLIPHARRAFGVMHADPAEELAIRAIRWLTRRPEITETSRRDLFQGLKGGQAELTAEDLTPALDLLIEHGYLRPVPRPSVAGRPSEGYEVNPVWQRDEPAELIPQIPQNEPTEEVLGDLGDAPGDPTPPDRSTTTPREVSGDLGDELGTFAPSGQSPPSRVEVSGDLGDGSPASNPATGGEVLGDLGDESPVNDPVAQVCPPEDVATHTSDHPLAQGPVGGDGENDSPLTQSPLTEEFEEGEI